uniref:Tubulin polymerization promoting protein n=1 Tax=Pygocentrus nattereri TaxID=42514 RepID=A0A3B4CV61_PYGNA
MSFLRRVKIFSLSVCLIILSCLGCSADEVIKNYYTSTYGKLCYDTCKTHGKSYTRKGWDYCSPIEMRDYKGDACRDDHPCGKYDESYYWCKRKGWFGGWGYCGPVEPKTFLYISSTYRRMCTDDCSYDESYKYYWCHIDKGWDYCSPTPDVTYKNIPCRSDHSCGTHGYKYNWCWITAKKWDYCGVIKPGECTYYSTQRKKRQAKGNAVVFCTRTDKGNHVETTFYAESNPRALTDGSQIRNDITNLIALWDNRCLGNQARSNLIISRNLRIDLQGLLYIDGQQYYNLQIQLNAPRRPGQSTTFSQVFIPRNIPIPVRYVRFAFVESFRRRARVTVVRNDTRPKLPPK